MKQKHIYTFLTSLLLCLTFTQCESESKKQEGVNRQSYYRGMMVYTNNCEGCHQNKGQGLKDLYPPLAQSDFLKNNPKKAIQYIYNGTNDSIVVNGKPYNFQMPDNKHLSREQIADVMTYISNSWGNKSTSYDVKTINEILK